MFGILHPHISRDADFRFRLVRVRAKCDCGWSEAKDVRGELVWRTKIGEHDENDLTTRVRRQIAEAKASRSVVASLKHFLPHIFSRREKTRSGWDGRHSNARLEAPQAKRYSRRAGHCKTEERRSVHACDWRHDNLGRSGGAVEAPDKREDRGDVAEGSSRCQPIVLVVNDPPAAWRGGREV